MKWVKQIFILLGVLVIVGVGGYFGYNAAYAMGETAGYDIGYSAGEEVGYNSGKEDGLEEGYISGKADGYEEGVEASLGHGYTLRDPTYKEAIAFLSRDKTDKNEYIEDSYVCSHFARDVGNNAEEEGLRCAFVELRFPDGGHSIIAFNTVDNGLVFFAPQFDWEVKPVTGKRYYQCVEPGPGYYYEKPSYDDTIRDILVIW